MDVSFELHNLRSCSDLDGRSLFDTSNQVSRHACRETVGADEHMNPPTTPGEEQGRLTRRVAATNDDDLVCVAELRFFHEGRAVVNAGAFELREICERWLAIPSSCRDDHRPRGDRRPVF